MPELPEVETVVRHLRQPLIGRRVEGMWYDWSRTVHSPAPEQFAARIAGQQFQAVERRAKYILCHLDQDTLVVHLKMTGRLYVTDREAQHDADRWVHFSLDLDGRQQLRFSDSRKFGRVYLTDDVLSITGKLGPEPLSDVFTPATFASRMGRRMAPIKAVLLDQRVVAGIGNIYADEALHRAGLHPERRVRSLTEPEITRLHGTIQAALRDGIAHEGASINWYRKPDGSKGSSQNHFYAYGRTGEPCRACGTPIEKIVVGQRGTHFCPVCQPAKP